MRRVTRRGRCLWYCEVWSVTKSGTPNQAAPAPYRAYRAGGLLGLSPAGIGRLRRVLRWARDGALSLTKPQLHHRPLSN